MAELPDGYVVHLTPRRLRIKVPGKRRDTLFFSDVRSKLAERPGVVAVEVNPMTSSVLIHCSDSRAFLDLVRSNAPFALAEPLSEAGQIPLLEEIRRSLVEANRHVKRLTGSRDDMRAYIFLVLVASAIYRLFRGDIFAPAATLLWYAGETLRTWAAGGFSSEAAAAKEKR